MKRTAIPEQAVVRAGFASAAGKVRTQAAGIVVLGVLTRLALVWHTAASGGGSRYFSKGVELGFVGRSIAAGRGFQSPFGVETGSTAYLAPGYPVVVGGIFRVLGTFTTQAAVAVMLLQTIFAAATLLMMMWIARRMVGGRSANVAGVFWALSPVSVALSTLFWETSCSAMLLTGLVAFALKAAADSGWRYCAGLGAVCGLAGLVNPALLPMAVLVVGWVGWRRRVAWRWLAITAFVMTVMYLPWPVRNAQAMHAFVPFRSNLGLELWEGNREGADGRFDERLHPYLNPAELNAYQAMGEMAYMRQKSALAKAYIRVHRAEFAVVTLKRCGRFWTGLEQPSNRISWLVAGHIAGTSLLGLLGLVLLLRREKGVALLFALPLLVFPLPYYVTHADARFRLLLDPLLTVLAAYALVRGLELSAMVIQRWKAGARPQLLTREKAPCVTGRCQTGGCRPRTNREGCSW